MTKIKKPSDAVSSTPVQTKIAVMIALLKQTAGATLAELAEATGWQAHSIRAALTGLRKKSHRIERIRRDGTTCYRIMDSAT